FTLKHQFTGSLNHIGDQLKKMGIVQANVSARDFVLPAEETRKKLQLKDGGDVYLFFTGKEVKTCYVTEKLR
ncbi:MAG: domain-like, partial [Bacteroidota bacterium]